MVIASLAFGIRIGTQHLAASAPPPPENDVFVSAQLRDLRFALDLYRREHGNYPPSFQELIEARWIDAEQVKVSGYSLHYLPLEGGASYQLDVDRSR